MNNFECFVFSVCFLGTIVCTIILKQLNDNHEIILKEPNLNLTVNTNISETNIVENNTSTNKYEDKKDNMSYDIMRYMYPHYVNHFILHLY